MMSLIGACRLADALAFLHKNNISFGAAHLNHMSISGKAARWFNFTSARIQTPGTRTRKVYIDDVQALMASLFVLLTGKAYATDIAIEPAGLQAVFRETFAGEITSATQSGRTAAGCYRGDSPPQQLRSARGPSDRCGSRPPIERR